MFKKKKIFPNHLENFRHSEKVCKTLISRFNRFTLRVLISYILQLNQHFHFSRYQADIKSIKSITEIRFKGIIHFHKSERSPDLGFQCISKLSCSIQKFGYFVLQHMICLRTHMSSTLLHSCQNYVIENARIPEHWKFFLGIDSSL